MSSIWKIEFSPGARKDIKRLDHQAAKRVIAFLEQRLATVAHPRALGKPLTGSRLGNLWRYRVGDYRIIAAIEDGTLTVLVVRIGHRRQVYR